MSVTQVCRRVEITLTYERQKMGRSQKVNFPLFPTRACSQPQGFPTACLEDIPCSRETDWKAVAGLATPHLAFAFPTSLPHFYFSFALATWGLQYGRQWWGMGPYTVHHGWRRGSWGVRWDWGAPFGTSSSGATASHLSSQQLLRTPRLFCPLAPVVS